MSETTISLLGTGSTPTGSEVVPADQAGTTVKLTVDQIAGRSTSVGAVSTSRTITTGTGLSGGGDLSADRTLSVSMPGYVAGRWIAPYIGTLGASAVIPAGAIKFIPFRLERTITVTGLGCRITAGVAASNIQLAIYANNLTGGQPTGSALLSTANISSASAVAVSQTSMGPVTLDANTVYWAGFNNSVGTVAAQVVLAANVSPMGRMIGATNLADLTNGATTAALMLEYTQAFGTWPDVTAGPFTTSTTGRQIAVYLQIDTLP